MVTDFVQLEKLSKLVRYYSLVSTTTAGSGHPSSCLSATDLMVGLMFGGVFKYRVNQPNYINNDRLVFSKGHAAPLFYSLWAAAGAVTVAKLKTLRKFKSVLEGHPTMLFPYTEAATGSLGQGLSVGVGLAKAAFLKKLTYQTYVLLGDSELSEGQVWEAAQLAGHYKLNNLVAIVDVNRLGQRGPTMAGHNLKSYQNKFTAFGWDTILINGHNWADIIRAFNLTKKHRTRPLAIIAKTTKGQGIKIMSNKLGWHGRALTPMEFKKSVKELGPIDLKIKGIIAPPANRILPRLKIRPLPKIKYKLGEVVSTREAYGRALTRIYPAIPNLVALDAEVSNSTGVHTFAKKYPQRFWEMFIAEQNMASVAVGLSRAGLMPFVSTFSAFFTRAFDQIRMSQYSNANIKFIGSHAGVAIGADGASQMGLEDIAMFRTLPQAVVLCPADAVACEYLVDQAARHKGVVYIRTARNATPIIYKNNEKFNIGGSNILISSPNDVGTVVTAGVTLYEALKAAEALKKQGIAIRVIDLYSIQPLDKATLLKSARQTKFILTVEDHRPAGGLGEAVAACLAPYGTKVISLAVTKQPRSGQPQQLLDDCNINFKAIIKIAKQLAKKI